MGISLKFIVKNFCLRLFSLLLALYEDIFPLLASLTTVKCSENVWKALEALRDILVHESGYFTGLKKLGLADARN